VSTRKPSPDRTRWVADSSPIMRARGCHSARVWPCACGPPPRGRWVRRHDHLRQRLPIAPCCCPCAASLALAASCTPARVCTSLSLRLAVPSCASVSAAAPPQRLQRCKRLCLRLLKQSPRVVCSRPPEQPQQRRLPVTSHPSCPCPAARACGLPAAARAGQPLARGVWAHPVLGSVEKAV
jgi:hypothetical protein